MKRILLLLFLFTCLATVVHAQKGVAGWTIKWNKKTILQSGAAGDTEKTKKFRRSDLEKKYFFELKYKEPDPVSEKEWKRSFIFADEKDNEVYRADSTRFVRLSAAQLKKLFKVSGKKIRVFTMSIPVDPDLAARVRVRRVLLCTLELQ